MTDTILQTLGENGVLEIALNRPDKKNAFNRDQWLGFKEAITEANSNPAVACVLVHGVGKDFSAGVDLNDFSAADADYPFEAAAKALVELEKPLVCAAKGVAIGGGATLLLQADVVYVGDSLKMRFPFVALGLVPEWGSSYSLAASIGSRRAAELMYTAEFFGAEKAVEMGIATAQYSDESLLEKAREKAAEIAQWPVSALVATKKTLREHQAPQTLAAMKSEWEGMQKLAGSPENIEAVMAFIEKRQPDFKQFRK